MELLGEDRLVFWILIDDVDGDVDGEGWKWGRVMENLVLRLRNRINLVDQSCTSNINVRDEFGRVESPVTRRGALLAESFEAFP